MNVIQSMHDLLHFDCVKLNAKFGITFFFYQQLYQVLYDSSGYIIQLNLFHTLNQNLKYTRILMDFLYIYIYIYIYIIYI